MRSALAARLSRFLVGCYPRRWRQRYGEELLDVLGQHRAGARTVLNLAASAFSTHLDPAYRRESLPMIRPAKNALAVAGVVVLFCLLVLGSIGLKVWQESHWTPGDQAGVTALVFSPDRRILVSATGFDEDGTDTVWNVARPAQPQQLATFEGGAPTAIRPDGRMVATVSFHDQPVLWSLADPARPAKIATLPGVPNMVLWGQAFSPDGATLAAAYTNWLYLWDVADPARARRLAALPFHAAAPPHWYGFPGDIAFSPDGRTLAATTSHNQVGLWDVVSPARATRLATLGGHTAPVAAIAFAPGGHLLADVGHDGTVIVFNVTDPAHPVRTATMHTVAGPQQAAGGGYYTTTYTLEFTPGGHTLTAIASTTAPSAGPATTAAEKVSRWRVTSAGAVTPLTTIARSTAPASGQLALAPNGTTLARGAPPGGDTIDLSALP